MQPVLNIEDVRRVELGLTAAGVSISELMHRAGLAAAEEVLQFEQHEQVVVLCGLGNNGGDGWVAAEDLHGRGINVSVVSPVLPDEINGDLARVVAKSAEGAGVSVVVSPSRPELEELLASADVILDAMFGTGFHGSPRTPFDIWIECVNASGAQVISIDVPSGLSAQRGHAEGACVVADETITMLTLKPGLLSDKGRDVCGAIVVAPLAEQTERLAVEADPVAWRADLEDYQAVIEPSSTVVDKFSRGSVLVVGGSSRYVGAPILAAKAAARAGAGYVMLAVPDSIASQVQAHVLEMPVFAIPTDREGNITSRGADRVARLAEKFSAVLVGPGLGVHSGTVATVSALLNTKIPLVIDADGLNCLSRLTDNQVDEYPELLRRADPLVLTPHRLELGRLVGLQKDPPNSLTSALDAARRVVWSDGGSELCVVAKGNASACVGVEVAILPKPGSAALATAGSGDALAGIIAALLSRSHIDNAELPLLSAFACEIHGLAGSIAAERFGSRSVMASDIIDAVGLALDELEEHATYSEELI